MIYLKLFLTFLKIGAVSFGGGYGMISLIREDCLRYGWLTEDELLNFIAVAESTPGPIAVNMATFVGSSQSGILGALLSTLGVVLPSFFIILAVAALFGRLLKYAGVKAALGGIRPAIVGMIVATSLIMLLSAVFKITDFESVPVFDLKALIIFVSVTALSFMIKGIFKKTASPIMLILFSGVMGVMVFGL